MSMRREATAEFVTRFTGDLSDIMDKVEAYKNTLNSLATAHKTFSSETDVAIKNVGKGWEAALSTTAKGTLRQLENFKDMKSSMTDVKSGFMDTGLAVSNVARSFASFGHIIANLQMPMIWMQWRQEQLMSSTRRIRELTETYTESLKANGPAADQTRRALGMLNEEKVMAAVYTQRMERAELMMNLAYITTVADIFPAFAGLIRSINDLRKLSISTTALETAVTWLNVHAHTALIAVKAALAPYMVPLMIAGAAAATAAIIGATAPRTARGQYGGVARNEGWAYIERNESLTPEGMGKPINVTINVNGVGNATTTANTIRTVLEDFFSGQYRSRGFRPL